MTIIKIKVFRITYLRMLRIYVYLHNKMVSFEYSRTVFLNLISMEVKIKQHITSYTYLKVMLLLVSKKLQSNWFVVDNDCRFTEYCHTYIKT